MLLVCAGLVRVTLAANAAEAAIDAWSLRAEVKAERQAGRTLQADRSALASPSRIEVLACQTLNMTTPATVAHLSLPENMPAEQPTAVAEAEGPSRAEGLVSMLVDLAAGEAQVLLVGDMGIGSAR